MTTSAANTARELAPRPTLYQLLCDAELTAYYTSMKSQLKVQSCEHLKYVTDTDLVGIGMSKPECRRLWKFYHRDYPASLFGRLKRRVLSKVNTVDATSDNNANKQSMARSTSLDLPSSSSPDALSSPRSPAPEQHIIPACNVTLCKQLGVGEFGSVWQAVWTPAQSSDRIQVAVKVIDSTKMQSNPLEFIQEAAIMHKVHHENIVQMYGVVLETKTIMLVSELAPLRSLSECLRERSLRESFPVERLCDYAEQICAGMVYLEANRFIHRDLAARNILVFSVDKVKISDFGLSKSLRIDEEYYRTQFTAGLKLPIAWCAPECINHLKFTSASDVWAFGVTLWEMFTYGLQPWAGMNGQEIIDAIDQPRGERLEVPDSCPREYYDLMLQCWKHEPSQRPKFSRLAEQLPDMRVERVQAVLACADQVGDHLQYDAGAVITVLDKWPALYPDGYYWRGVLPSGRTGLFLPSNTVAHISVECPKLPSAFRQSQSPTMSLGSTGESKSDKSKSKSSSPAPHGGGGLGDSKSKHHHHDRRLEISLPVDMRHVAHYGLDGQCFGDLGALSPTAIAQNGIATQHHSATTTSTSRGSALISTPTLINGNDIMSQSCHTNICVPTSYAPTTPTKTAVDNSSTQERQSSSLLDEVFEALQIGAPAVSTKNQPGDDLPLLTDSIACSSGYHDNLGVSASLLSDYRLSSSVEQSSMDDSGLGGAVTEQKIIPRYSKVDKNRTLVDVKSFSRADAQPPASTTSEAPLRPVSHSESRKIDRLCNVAQKMSDKALERENEALATSIRRYDANDNEIAGSSTTTPSDAKTIAATGSNEPHVAKTPALSVSTNGNEVDGLEVKATTKTKTTQQQQWTPEAEDAYKMLVECGRTVASAGHAISPTGRKPQISPTGRPLSKPPPPPIPTEPPPPSPSQTPSSPTTTLPSIEHRSSFNRNAPVVASKSITSASSSGDDDTVINPLRQIRHDASSGVALSFRPGGGSFHGSGSTLKHRPGTAVRPQSLRHQQQKAAVPTETRSSVVNKVASIHSPTGAVAKAVPPPIPPKPKFENSSTCKAPPHPLLRTQLDAESGRYETQLDKYELLDFVMSPLNNKQQQETKQQPSTETETNGSISANSTVPPSSYVIEEPKDDIVNV